MQRNYLSWHWSVIQNLKKNWLVVWKMTWGICQISPGHLKVSKLGLWWEPFIQSRKCMSLKFTEEICVLCLDNRKRCKIWREIDLQFQNWYEEFDDFWPEHSKVSKICALMGSFWSKYIMFELKKYGRVMFDDTENWCNIWRKTDLCFQNWQEEFGKLSQAEK